MRRCTKAVAAGPVTVDRAAGRVEEDGAPWPCRRPCLDGAERLVDPRGRAALSAT